jgi:hypothetical protein
MSRNIVTLVLLAAAGVALRGDSCFLQNKDIEVPFRGETVMDYTSTGDSDADIVIVDVAQELEDLESDFDADVDSLVSLNIEGGFWRLVANRGDPGTTVTGSITITRLPSGPSGFVIAPTTVAIEAVGHEFVPAPLNEAGVDLLLAGFQEYVDWWNGGKVGPRPDIQYAIQWSSAGSGDVDFDWQAKLVFTMVGVFSVEVPDLWD